MKKRILISIALLSILLLSLIGVAVAWFYFPSTQNVIINTDTDYEINARLYELNTSTNRFVEILDADDEQTDYVLTGNAVASFYKWGSSFYTEIPLLKYYALELTYPEDTFGDGLGKFIVNSYLCSAGEMNETPLQIECTKLSYAISDSASIDLSTAQAANLAMNSSFTEIVFAHNDDTICDDENYYKENELNIVLRDLNQYQYRYEYTDNNDESFEMCRVIVFLKLEDNASKIQTEISGIALSLSGLMISVTNYYKFNFYLRSIPYKDDNLHD